MDIVAVYVRNCTSTGHYIGRAQKSKLTPTLWVLFKDDRVKILERLGLELQLPTSKLGVSLS